MMNEPEDELTLTPAQGEDLYGPELQGVLGAMLHDLQAQGVRPSSRMFCQDSADTGGMWFLGQYGFEAAKIAIPAFAGIVGGYLTACAGRKVKLKIGDTEVEAHSVAEVEKLLDLISKEKERRGQD